MESTINLIDNYLTESLSKSDVQLFENRLLTDVSFKNTYLEHVALLGGIERVALKQEIKKARANYLKMKWLKIGIITALAIMVMLIIFKLMFTGNKTEELPETSNQTQSIEQIEVTTTAIDTSKTNTSENELMGKTAVASVVVEKAIKKTPKNQVPMVINDRPVDNSNAVDSPLDSFFKSNKKEPEEFTVNTNELITINLKEGTQIVIPANAFLDEITKETITGTIDFYVTEYYQLSDILIANLSTTCNDQILETGGMLFIEASQNGNPLVLKENKPLEINFNTDKADMDLFNGEFKDDTINWVLSDEFVDDIAPENDQTIPFSIVQVAPTYPGCENLNNEEHKDCVKDKIERLFGRYFDTSLIKTSDKEKIGILFDIDEAGNIININTTASTLELRYEAIRVTKLIPQMIPGSHNGRNVKVRYGIPLFFNVTNGGVAINSNKSARIRKKFKEHSVRDIARTDTASVVVINGFRANLPTARKELDSINSALEQNKDTVSGFISNLDNSTIERYALSSTKLGWINCDRFRRFKNEKVKMKFKVKNADGASVKMIFKSISSVLPSKNSNEFYDFGYVPKGEEVVLIAIKKEGDTLFLATEELQTKALSSLEMNFKPVSLKEMKSQLQELNKSF